MNRQTAETPNRFSDKIDATINRVGNIMMWANVVVMLLIILQVILRYGFGHGLIILEELQWHFYAVAFMFGLSYAVMTDSHVGMDLVYEKLSAKAQCRLDIFGILFLLLPFATLICYQSLPFVHEAWRLNESSMQPQGLPWRWAIKAVMPTAFGFLILAALSRLVRTIATLRRL
ncbi:MAG: TRAP transporter small permease subunit [Pseudomonadota bacterium]|nr:TRAP transporter small permease subunit [Pseudomonadota bacterium]